MKKVMDMLGGIGAGAGLASLIGQGVNGDNESDAPTENPIEPSLAGSAKQLTKDQKHFKDFYSDNFHQIFQNDFALSQPNISLIAQDTSMRLLAKLTEISENRKEILKSKKNSNEHKEIVLENNTRQYEQCERAATQIFISNLSDEALESIVIKGVELHNHQVANYNHLNNTDIPLLTKDNVNQHPEEVLRQVAEYSFEIFHSTFSKIFDKTYADTVALKNGRDRENNASEIAPWESVNRLALTGSFASTHNAEVNQNPENHIANGVPANTPRMV